MYRRRKRSGPAPFALRFLLATDLDSLTLVLRTVYLNIHFQLIFLNGVYLSVEGGLPVFRQVPAPTGAKPQALVQQIAARIGKVLEQHGMVERDMENAWLVIQGERGLAG
jgi:hypothetical protein